MCPVDSILEILRFSDVRKAPTDELEGLKRVIAKHHDLLDLWLAGPEATTPNPSPEYLAFTHMRMAADGCCLNLDAVP